MNHVKRWSILFIVLSVLVVLNADFNPVRGVQRADRSTTFDGASSAYRLDWAAVGEVSGGNSASTGYRLSATIGQMGAGASTSAHFALCVGFQCAASGAGNYRVYLPLVLK